MQAFMALADKPLPQREQKQFEQRCLRATISANLPLWCRDDDEFRGTYTDVRPELVVPTRRTISGRILDEGYLAAKEQVLQSVKTSDGGSSVQALNAICLVLVEKADTSQAYTVLVLTGICICTDSWTSIRRQQIMAFVMITSDRKVSIFVLRGVLIAAIFPALRFGMFHRHCLTDHLTHQQSATLLRF